MSELTITLGLDSRDILLKLREVASASGMEMLRLKASEVVVLILEEPEIDDVIINHNGLPLLAVSRSLMESIGEKKRLEITDTEDGEPIIKIVGGSPGN